MLSFVADPDVYPGFRTLIFIHPGLCNPDFGSQTNNKKSEKKDLLSPFFAAINVTKLNIVMFFEQ
jgi:hypothetical protein